MHDLVELSCPPAAQPDQNAFTAWCENMVQPITSSLSLREAWDRVGRSLIIEPPSLSDPAAVREREAMLAWGGAHILDDRPWRALPDALMHSLARVTGFDQIWDGIGRRPNHLVDVVFAKFLHYSQLTGSSQLDASTKGPTPLLTLGKIRDSDAAEFYQRLGPTVDLTTVVIADDPDIDGHGDGAKGGPTSGAVRTPALVDRIRSLFEESLREVLKCHGDGRQSGVTAGMSSADPWSDRLTSTQAKTVMEKAIAEARGGGADWGSAPAITHRKARTRKRRHSDSGSDSENDDPDNRIRRANRSLRDALGGLSVFTDETRAQLPILMIPAHRISAELVETYLRPARFRATYLWGSKSTADVTKLLMQRQKVARALRKGREVLDPRSPFDTETDFSWNLDLLHLGTNQDLRASASMWGDMLLQAFAWATQAQVDLVSFHVNLGLARSAWVSFELAVNVHHANPSPTDLNVFKAAVVAAFAMRLQHMRAELSRLPTIMQAAEAQAAQVVKFLDLVCARISESIFGSLVGGFAGFLARSDHTRSQLSEAQLWLLVYRPFFTNVLNSANAITAVPHIQSPALFTNLSALHHSVTVLPSRTGSFGLSDRSASLSSPSAASYQTVQAELRPPPYSPPPSRLEYAAGGSGFGEGGGFDGGDRRSVARSDAWRNDRGGSIPSSGDRDRSSTKGGRSRFSGPPPPMCRPMSSAVVGIKIARLVPPPKFPVYTCGHCQSQISHVNGPHRGYECPLGYFQTYREPCPGFDAEGHAIAGDWSSGGTILRKEAKEKWKTYIERHKIPPDVAEAKIGGGVDYDNDRVGPMQDTPRGPPGRAWRALARP